MNKFSFLWSLFCWFNESLSVLHMNKIRNNIYSSILNIILYIYIIYISRVHRVKECISQYCRVHHSFSLFYVIHTIPECCTLYSLSNAQHVHHSSRFSMCVGGRALLHKSTLLRLQLTLYIFIAN